MNKGYGLNEHGSESYCCSTSTQQCFNFQWNDDEVHFVLDQRA